LAHEISLSNTPESFDQATEWLSMAREIDKKRPARIFSGCQDLIQQYKRPRDRTTFHITIRKSCKGANATVSKYYQN
jgi:coproporphyrinogen III oxidase